MKIWVIGRNYPDKSNNYQGSFELEQAKMLAKRGNDVTYIACVLHPFWRIQNGGFVEFEDGPLTVCAYSGFFTPHMTEPWIQFPYFPKSRNKRWKALLNKAEEHAGCPDVIHIHFPLMVLSAEVFEGYHDRGVKVVVTEHWTKVLNKKIDAYEKQQMMKYLAFTDTYMAVGYSLREAILESSKTGREIVVMPNVINDVFRPASQKHEGFVFGLVGRLSAVKQMDRVIEAFADQFQGAQNVRLVIVGAGAEGKRLDEQVNTLGVKDQVVFKGALNREDTAQVIKGLDCLVCFSRVETFGVPVIEAWACGVPVITTTADCLTDEWDDRLGISVRCTDEEALGAAMKKMVYSIAAYDRRFIADYALSRYSEDCVYDRLMDIYR